jgi:hypothetical protein
VALGPRVVCIGPWVSRVWFRVLGLVMPMMGHGSQSSASGFWPLASGLGSWLSILGVGDVGRLPSCARSIKQAPLPIVVRGAARTGVDGKVSPMDDLALAKRRARWWYGTVRPIMQAAHLPCCVEGADANCTPRCRKRTVGMVSRETVGGSSEPTASESRTVRCEFHVDLHVLSLNVRLEGHQWRTKPRPKGGLLSVHFLG